MVSNTNSMHDSDQYDINSSDSQPQKRNRTSYLLFKKLHRQEFIDSNPELTKPELIQKISAAYLLLSQEERDKLQRQYEEITRPQSRSKKRLRKKKEWRNEVIKGNEGVYNLFRKRHMSKIIKENNRLQKKDVFRRIGEAYRNLSMDEKEKLRDDVRKNAAKRRLDQQMKKKKMVKKQYSVFALFYKERSHEVKKNNPKFSSRDVMKEVARIYRNLREKEKQDIQDRAKELRDAVPKKRRRPQLNFMLFAEEKRPFYLQKFPNKSQEDIAQLIGWEWKISPETIKERYKRESRRRLAQYRLATRPKNIGNNQ